MYNSTIARWNGVDGMAAEYQNMSTYGFVANNPLNHVEVDGQFFVVDDWLVGGIKGLFNGEGFVKSAKRHARNSINIWKSFTATDKAMSKKFQRRQVISRFTWELPTQLAGVIYNHFVNMTVGIKEVEDLNNGTVHVEMKIGRKSPGWDVTLGNLINTNEFTNYEKPGSSRNNKPHTILTHGLGHYIQSRRLGPLYLFTILPASPIVNILGVVTGKNPRKHYWPENKAEELAKKYNEERSLGTDVLQRFDKNADKEMLNANDEKKQP